MILTLTAGYPFGGEPFLISEDLYAPEELIYLALHPSKEENQSRHRGIRIAEKRNVFVMAIWALRGLVDPLVWHEMGWMRKNRKLSLHNVGVMLGYYAYAKRCYREIYRWMKNENLLRKDTIMYSYWMVTHAMICALVKRKVPNMRILTRCHGYDIYEYRYPGEYLPFRDFIFRSMDAICPISADGVHYLEQTYAESLEKHKISLHRLGTLEKGTTPPKGKGEPFRLVSCSSMIPLKRIHLLIAALSKIGQPVEWVHFGDGPLMSTLQNQAKDTLSQTSVQYIFEGHVPNEEVLQYYKENHVDVFLNVSETEGVPLSIMEALSFGIPVIATKVGGTGEIVTSGLNGTLLPKDVDPSALSNAIRDMMVQSDEERNTMCRKARESWEKNCSAEKNYRDFYAMVQNR